MPACDRATLAGAEASTEPVQRDPAEGAITSLSLAGLSAGRRLRLRRVRVGLAQRELARLAGVAASLMSDVERDVPPPGRTPAHLAAAAVKVEAVLEPLEARWR